MKKITALRELLVEELKDLHSAETQLMKALQKACDAAASDALKTKLAKHLLETEGHVRRLKKIGQQMGEGFEGKTCKAMQGLIAEGEEILAIDADPAMKDLAIIGASQKLEHYEIAGYGTAKALAEHAGESQVAELLKQTLHEEEETDRLLSALAGELQSGSLRKES